MVSKKISTLAMRDLSLIIDGECEHVRVDEVESFRIPQMPQLKCFDTNCYNGSEIRSIALKHPQTEIKQRAQRFTWFGEKKFTYIHE